ncbi:MAG: type II toxin-antitoxin system YafQ family toxin [Campylobacterota bacterium]|nr:type II toxin-antitoxin system YafQ family toxin [Campylobacterota bacterium]
MLKIKRHKQYNKDFAKCEISDQHYAKFIVYLSQLIKQEELPPEALDHSLKGKFVGYREFHISGDLVVIYKVYEGILYLVRIGTHSQLFR